MQKLIVMVLVSLIALPLCSQTENAAQQSPVPAMVGINNSATPAESYNLDKSEDRMVTPPPVSGQAYPVMLASESRSNYVRAGLSFTGAYTDNVLGTVPSSRPISDESYSMEPMIALDETKPRLHYLLTYAPGFTFYQHSSSRNEADHNASIEFEYRLSPHITLSALDSFQKSSDMFSQPPDLMPANVVSAGAQSPNFSVIVPVADRLSNSGNVGLSYQFALNDMVGVSGTFSNLRYPNQKQVLGLYDPSSQGGLAYYSHRIDRGQYVGFTYEYQRLLSRLNTGNNETQTHAALFFYTFSPVSSRFSFSLFGGPQYSDTVEPPSAPQQLQTSETQLWTPAAGASLGWQGKFNSFAVGYTHVIASGGGLIGAVQLDSATISARQHITRTLSASLSAGYAQNDVVGGALTQNDDGHTISGAVSLQQQVGEHLGVQVGYTHLHQVYSNVAVLSTNPDTNRASVSISYQFSRPLGR